ncbi:MAG: SDR family oxidoreductase [Deltaproteobacteria bacterium]|nr:SDR family oxidoreductase [Deltaproteobacteria bacterium]
MLGPDEAPTPVTVITGASSGIGAAMADVLAARGHHLVLVALEDDLLAAVRARLERQHSVRVFSLALDLAAPGAAERVLFYLQAEGLRAEILINNAGLGLAGDFHRAPLEKIRRVMAVNMSALVDLTHGLVQGMVTRAHGRILNTASTAAFQPGPGMAVYFATKAFVTSFSQALASELEGSGVTVTAFCPGPTRTGFAAAAGLTHERHLEKVASFADPTRVAELGYHAMMRGRRLAIPGGRNRFFARLATWLPTGMVMRSVKRLHRQA